MNRELDTGECHRLGEQLLEAVRDFQHRRPCDRSTTCEAMQALAWAVAPLVAVDPVAARAWFDSALDRAVGEMLVADGEG